MSNTTKILISTNLLFLIAICCLLLWPKKTQIIQTGNIDLVNQLHEAEKKSLKELSDKLDEIDKKQMTLMQNYQNSLNDLNKKYDEKISLIEKEKSSSTKKIVESFKNDMPGLADKFSQETGMKVFKK